MQWFEQRSLCASAGGAALALPAGCGTVRMGTPSFQGHTLSLCSGSLGLFLPLPSLPQLSPSPHGCSGVSRDASHILSSTTFLCSTRQELFPTPCKTFHPLSGHFLPSCHQFPSDFSPCAGSYIIPDEIPPRICAAALQGACPGRQLPQNAFPVYRRLCCEHESPLELLRSPAGLF